MQFDLSAFPFFDVGFSHRGAICSSDTFPEDPTDGNNRLKNKDIMTICGDCWLEKKSLPSLVSRNPTLAI